MTHSLVFTIKMRNNGIIIGETPKQMTENSTNDTHALSIITNYKKK